MLLLANTLVASIMFAAGCALLTSILLRRSYRYFGRRRRYDDSPIARQPRPTSQWSGAYSDSSAMIERQKVELHDAGRELRAQLDNKIVVLQELCARSQQQIDRMEELLRELDSRG
ncbi:hypothetical protein Pla123a_02440 [Posidoniimonas polymericola]|uniref:Uncharacterized protein n=1 Tax=Posidoniimonas polymericola TaxID=2528002 RepID=A0A5C5ZEF4_9BACT|nr:hypothetical protein [Posidoniimonas polymericola]TWT85437.1 hypothetical protein Pla123a_02440 [Posidoniimonas polymericola]